MSSHHDVGSSSSSSRVDGGGVNGSKKNKHVNQVTKVNVQRQDGGKVKVQVLHHQQQQQLPQRMMKHKLQQQEEKIEVNKKKKNKTNGQVKRPPTVAVKKLPPIVISSGHVMEIKKKDEEEQKKDVLMVNVKRKKPLADNADKTQHGSSHNKMKDQGPLRKRTFQESACASTHEPITLSTKTQVTKPPPPVLLPTSKSRIDSHWNQLQGELQHSTHPHKKRRIHGHGNATVDTISSSSTPSSISDYTIVALDCEMVGVGPAKISHLARVFAMNERHETLLDLYVKPTQHVTDHRTKWSGILPHHLRNGITLLEAKKRVEDVISGRILVGHDLRHDMESLGISHPPHLIRDTAKYTPFLQDINGILKPRRLKHLVLENLSREIQTGQQGHDPKEDAQGCLDLYLKFKKDWERSRHRVKKDHVQ